MYICFDNIFELQMIVSCHVNDRSQSWVFWKSIQASYTEQPLQPLGNHLNVKSYKFNYQDYYLMHF